MNYKKIIQHAWTVTNSHPKLIWYGFVPALIGTIVGTVYLLYQGFAFWAFFNKFSIFSMLLQYGGRIIDILTANVAVTVILAVIGIIFGISYLFVPIIFYGGLVKLLSKILFNKPFQYRTGLPMGMIYFFPLFNYNASVAPFSIITLIFFSFTLLRNFGPETVMALWPLFLIMLIVDLVVMLFCTFAQYFILLENQKTVEALRNSVKLVFLNLEATFFLMMMMGLIGLRIVLNIVSVLVIPGTILAVTYFFTGHALQVLSLWLGIVGGVIGIVLVSYLTGILNVFIATVWTMTFYTLLKNTQGFDEMLEEEAKMAM